MVHTGEVHRKGTGEAHRGVDITGEVSRFNATPPRSHCAFRIASFADKTTTIFFLKMCFSFASWSQGTETINIARGTTDPEIDSVTWIKFINNMARLVLVAYLATRWRHLY